MKPLLAYSVIDGRGIHRMDVDATFLIGAVEGKIYLMKLVGFIDAKKKTREVVQIEQSFVWAKTS